MRRVSHLVYEQHHGALGEGMCVLHTCDNPPCANPQHLFAGTRADNRGAKKDELYPCKPDIFEATYEKVSAEDVLAL